MRILITGCKGQLGRFLVQQFCYSDEVLGLDSSQLNITDKVQVFSVIKSFKPEFIINAAAYTAVDSAETNQEKADLVNNVGPRYLAEAAQTVGAVIIHISTDYVFDGERKGQYLETDLPLPQSVYGASKLAGELAVATSCNSHIILRTSWVFSEYGNNFVKTMLRLAQTNSELSVVGDQFGGPTYAGDIAKAIAGIVSSIYSGNKAWGVYHFSGQPQVSWFEFSQRIFDQAYFYGVIDSIPVLHEIKTEQYPTPARRPRNSTLDCQKIMGTFNIQPSDWMQSLKGIKGF